MKSAILIRSIILPLIFILIVGYNFYTGQDPFKIFVAILMLFIVVARIFLRDRRYLISLDVTDSHLEIQYYSEVLKLKSMKIPVSEISAMEFRKIHWLADYAASVDIKWEEEWFNFQIVQRKQIPNFQTKLNPFIRQLQPRSLQFPRET